MYLFNYNRRKPKSNFMIDRLKNDYFFNEKNIEINTPSLKRELSKAIRFKMNDK